MGGGKGEGAGERDGSPSAVRDPKEKPHSPLLRALIADRSERSSPSNELHDRDMPSNIIADTRFLIRR